MGPGPDDTPTRLLDEASDGDPRAAARLIPLVYEELRALAARRVQRETPGQTLQPTALVHEAFVRLIDQERAAYRSRTHFFAVAAETVRRVIVDHARERAAMKRGGGRLRMTLTSLDERAGHAAPPELDALALDEALGRLAELDARQARVVELRFFGGLGVEETARMLEVSPRTVEEDWRMARAWLKRELSRGARGEGPS